MQEQFELFKGYAKGFDLDTGEKRNSRYNKLNDAAQELLSTIERKNDRLGITGLTQADRTRLEQAVQNGDITEYELEIILDLLGC